MDNAMMMY